MRLQVVRIAKNHNMFGQAEKFMKRFAKICYDMREVGRGDIADALEEILNAEIAIAGPTKKEAIKL